MAHPLDLLHGVGELWPVIASKLGPQDLYNLSHAHPYWFTLLQRRRPNFPMQLCLPLLTNRGLGLTDLLTLRLVSKTWNRSVDHYLQHQMYEQEPFVNEKHAPTDFHICAWHSRSRKARQRKEVLVVNPLSPFERNLLRQISAWLDLLELTPSPSANPILSREAQFIISGIRHQELLQETTDLVSRCLKAHGRHLLRCTFEVYLGLDAVGSFQREYSQLRDWLSLVPNLIWLEVDFCRLIDIHNEAELVAHIQDNPLPELLTLSRLRVQGLPPAILQALLHKYNQVQTLELGITDHEEYRLDPVQLENLNTLKLQLRGANGLVALQQVRTDSWLLNLHTLEIMVNGFGISVRLGVLIDFLNSNFGAAGRLVNLGLHMHIIPPSDRARCTRLLEDTQTCRLKLPGVKQLKLVARNVFLLEFLLPMRHTLKKLAISNNRESIMDECQQLIQWNGWPGRHLLTSNIWEAFPQLNFIRAQNTEFRGWTYRRREGGAPINFHSYRGVNVSYEEDVDWEEVANRNGDAVDA